ncbi:hypothetical protein IWW38_004145 [Coemansia aciculifera]|uniref:Uncharacterized protein n=1 Tax=Coemansia aciculifera TaxID=417176 RepID=A0ACC1M0D8_9FUNG|nr:hypothetical protein IWW38_004145 [Coemansia aciculifera]
MDSSELNAIKAQLSGGNGKDTANTVEKTTQNEQRQTMLAQILAPDALQRLGQMALVKKEKVRAVEDMLINMARMNQIRARVTEDELKGMLQRINDEHDKETKIVYSRKAYESEEEEEYNFD